MVCRHNIVDISQFRDGKRHDFWLILKGVDTGKIHLAITVLDKQAESHSSEDTPSTTLEVTPLVLFVYSSSSWPFMLRYLSCIESAAEVICELQFPCVPECFKAFLLFCNLSYPCIAVLRLVLVILFRKF